MCEYRHLSKHCADAGLDLFFTNLDAAALEREGRALEAQAPADAYKCSGVADLLPLGRCFPQRFCELDSDGVGASTPMPPRGATLSPLPPLSILSPTPTSTPPPPPPPPPPQSQSQSFVSVDPRRVVVLDPEASQILSPHDAADFDYFLVGGILGEEELNGRTGEGRFNRTRSVLSIITCLVFVRS
jgi:hypothetical protein